jgi:hypothetical protein
MGVTSDLVGNILIPFPGHPVLGSVLLQRRRMPLASAIGHPAAFLLSSSPKMERHCPSEAENSKQSIDRDGFQNYFSRKNYEDNVS